MDIAREHPRPHPVRRQICQVLSGQANIVHNRSGKKPDRTAPEENMKEALAASQIDARIKNGENNDE